MLMLVSPQLFLLGCKGGGLLQCQTTSRVLSVLRMPQTLPIVPLAPRQICSCSPHFWLAAESVAVNHIAASKPWTVVPARHVFEVLCGPSASPGSPREHQSLSWPVSLTFPLACWCSLLLVSWGGLPGIVMRFRHFCIQTHTFQP